MELELTDTERMLHDTFRSFFTREIEPHVPAMERGEILPYDLMRHMHRTLGLDAMLPAMRGGTDGERHREAQPSGASDSMRTGAGDSMRAGGEDDRHRATTERSAG